MAISKEELAAVLHREIAQATGYSSDQLSESRKEALNYYNGIMPAPAAGRSEIVSLDVADSVHALLAQVAPVIKTTQVEFEPSREGDEAQAQAESDFVRVVIERAGGYNVINASTHDAFLLANGWIHAAAVEETETIEGTFRPGLSDAEIAAIDESYDGAKTTFDFSETGTKVTFERKRKVLTIEAVPPEDMMFSETGASYDITKLRFVGRRRIYTAAALKEMGVSDADIELMPDAAEHATLEERQGKLQDTGISEAPQDAERGKLVYCCYVRVSSGTGYKSELRHVWMGGSTIILDEAAESVPYICGTAIPMPHRILGTSLFDLLRQIQQGKTHVLRQYMDNLSVMNASRMGAVDGRVNMDDLTNGRINGVVRVKSADALFPLPASDIGPQAMAGLSYLDSVRTQRIGSAVDFNEVQAQLMGTSATAAAGQLAKVEQMSGWFAQNIAQTILLPLFQLVHRILRRDMPGQVTARIGGKWQTTDTGSWPERDITNISMGMTTVEKAERLSGLQTVIAQQNALLQQGGAGVITDQKRLYNAMADWIRSSNLGAPDQYLIDPTSDEAAQAAQGNQAAAQQDEQKQLMIQAKTAQLMHHFEMQKQAAELDYKRWSDQLEADLKEAQMTRDALLKLAELRKSESEPAEPIEGAEDAED